MTDDSFFSNAKRSELADLKAELSDMNRDRQREAVQRVVQAMTNGLNVGGLFPDMLNCMHSPYLDVKKLVYLYVTTYARSNSELAILAVNSFRKDSMDNNPLIRALAVRTMSSMREDSMLEYLVDALLRASKDTDPYVRKTAALGIGKTYRNFPQAITDHGLLEILYKDLLLDSNPAVVVNATAALTEIAHDKSGIKLTTDTASALLTALNEVSEWGQVTILDCLALYEPPTQSAGQFIERLSPLFSHANAAVVLSAVKTTLKWLEIVSEPETIRVACKKMAGPLITLLAAEQDEPELQYTALRNIAIVAARRPAALAGEVKPFFIKYSDNQYVKKQKLSLLIAVATEKTADQILSELKDYATEVDLDFASLAVKSIGGLATKLERTADKCVSCLLDILDNGGAIIEDAFVILTHIIRYYPSRYQAILPDMIAAIGKRAQSLQTTNTDSLSSSTTGDSTSSSSGLWKLKTETRESLAYLVAEFSTQIKNGEQLMWAMITKFQALLTPPILSSVVKFSLSQPKTSQELLKAAIDSASGSTSDPDLRDRAYFYRRLMSLGVAKDVVKSSENKKIKRSDNFDANTSGFSTKNQKNSTLIGGLESLAGLVGSCASVYQDSTILYSAKRSSSSSRSTDGDDEDDDDDDDGYGSSHKHVLDLTRDSQNHTDIKKPPTSSPPVQRLSTSLNQPVAPNLLQEDPSDSDSDEEEQLKVVSKNIKKFLVLKPETAGSKGIVKGLKIAAGLGISNNQVFIGLTVGNFSQSPLKGPFAIQLNKNHFGLVPIHTGLLAPDSVEPGSFFETAVVLKKSLNNGNQQQQSELMIQVAMKTADDILYFAVPVDDQTATLINKVV